MYCCPTCGHLILDVTARIDTRIRITTCPDRNDTLVEELNDGDLSMQDADEMACVHCAETCTVREAQQAYAEDRWVPVTGKRRKPKKVWDYAYITRRMRQADVVTETILFDDEDIGEAYRLEPKVMVIAEVPLCRDLFLYDIVRVRNVPHGDMEKVSTCLQRYYASQHAIRYLPDEQMEHTALAKECWPTVQQALTQAGCAVTISNLIPGYAMVNAKAGVDVAALLAGLGMEGVGILASDNDGYAIDTM